MANRVDQLRLVSSESTLFAKVSVLVCMDERATWVISVNTVSRTLDGLRNLAWSQKNCHIFWLMLTWNHDFRHKTGILSILNNSLVYFSIGSYIPLRCFQTSGPCFSPQDAIWFHKLCIREKRNWGLSDDKICAEAHHFLQICMCAQRRLRSACAYMQTD